MKNGTFVIAVFAVVFLAVPILRGQDLTLVTSPVPAAGHPVLSECTNDTSVVPPAGGNLDAEPQIIYKVVPKYPEAARKKGMEGRVIVKLWVGPKGNVRKAILMKSTDPIFDKPSLDAAMKYKFSPGMYRDKPVSVWVIIPFNYRLKPESAETTSDTTLLRKYKTEMKVMDENMQRSNEYQLMITRYDDAMYFQRMKEHKKAAESYRDFLKRSKDFANAPREMVRHAEQMVKEYSKMEGKAK